VHSILVPKAPFGNGIIQETYCFVKNNPMGETGFHKLYIPNQGIGNEKKMRGKFG